MSERPEEMKDWLAYHREAPAILDYMTHLEDLLAEAQADAVLLDKLILIIDYRWEEFVRQLALKKDDVRSIIDSIDWREEQNHE